MPRPYPQEFREDVIRVARNRGPGGQLKTTAADFGISESCLAGWLKTADVEDGLKPGTTAAQNAGAEEGEAPAHRRTTTWRVGCSAPMARNGYGSPVSPSTGPMTASSTSAQPDVYSNRIVGYSIGDRMKDRLAVQVLENAVARRGDVAGCILHSDRGSQFRARKLHRALARHGMVGSMGQVGSAGDNTAMESFFALLQKNVLNCQRWATRDELRLAIVTWIERTYHRPRRQAALGRLTPIEFETIMTTPATQAA